LKKKLFLLFVTVLFSFLFACSEENKIYEINVEENNIDFPFEERDSGKFMSIFNNLSENVIPISIIMASKNEVIPDSQNADFCEGVNAYRSGKIIQEWITINHNFPLTPNIKVENPNDHPNLFSFNFPKGTYIFMLMNSESCSKDNYVIFDVLENSY
tara:strand:+ start:354 stop:824 length:471 start_codon:yes stop_codon:yes gene_type:complete